MVSLARFMALGLCAGCLSPPDPPACTLPKRVENARMEISSSENDTGPWLSPDRRELFFASDRNGDYQIFHANRESILEDFADVVEVSGLGVEPSQDPFFDVERQTLWFSHRDVDGTYYVYRARRTVAGSANFEPAERAADVGAGTHPSMTRDGKTLVFSARDAQNRKTLFRATRPSATADFGEREELTSVRGVELADMQLTGPSISAGGDRLLFAFGSSDDGPFQVAETDRLGSKFEPGVLEVDTEPSGLDDRDPAIHDQGETLMFSSNRDVGSGLDLFMACE